MAQALGHALKLCPVRAMHFLRGNTEVDDIFSQPAADPYIVRNGQMRNGVAQVTQRCKVNIADQLCCIRNVDYLSGNRAGYGNAIDALKLTNSINKPAYARQIVNVQTSKRVIDLTDTLSDSAGNLDLASIAQGRHAGGKRLQTLSGVCADGLYRRTNIVETIHKLRGYFQALCAVGYIAQCACKVTQFARSILHVIRSSL